MNSQLLVNIGIGVVLTYLVWIAEGNTPLPAEELV